MKYLDEFKDKEIVGKISEEIGKIDVSANIMEVCGTHTMSIFRSGLRSLLPKSINLISGPGCPVCVTSEEDIDKILACSDIPGTIIATFGDMMKVPGSRGSLKKKSAEGKDIKIVYSPLDALEMAKNTPKQNIIFVGVGFETTSPTVAGTVIKAKEKGLKNFSVICSHKVMPSPMRALLQAKETKIDGYICPGHVSTIIGSKPYEELVEEFRIPCVIAGFEPVDIMESILTMLKMIKGKEPEVAVEYKRAVKRDGNKRALEVLYEVFEESDANWRGIGNIPGSGLKIRPGYEEFDAEKKFNIKVPEAINKKGCMCGEILKGNKIPTECKLFGKICTPEKPAGACMVSSEGTCAAYYKYGRQGL